MRAALFGAAAVLPLADAAAITLGRMQASPLIGRPLQGTVPLTLQPEETLSCVRAELQQPEMPPVPLAWRFEQAADGSAFLRLSSSAPVREPIITVKLVVGCNDQFTQGYVLLADPPPMRETVPLVDAPAPAVATPAPPPARNAGRTAPATTTVTTNDGLRFETALARPAAPPAAAPAPAARPAPEARPAPRRAARPAAKAAPPAPAPASPPAPQAGRPRLQVDLLDIAIDQAPALKVSTQLAPPAANAMTRSEAAAAWQEINAPLEQQLAQSKAQSEAIQAELKALREQTRRQAELLQKMQEERNLVRDLLAGLAGAIALGLAFLLWRRSREAGGGRPWWQKERSAEAPVAPQVPDSSFVDSSVPDDDPPVRVAPEPDSGWAVARPSRTGAPRGADSGYGRSRLPSAEELLDVQEKANFFLAIGQPEKAIELLESRLLEHLGASPFLWLDLLDLCRTLDRRDDYERVRKEFQKAFAARMPPFDEAQPNTEGLERYPKALSRIELLWPGSRVLQEIEKSLFQDPAPGSIMFDLEASRDLLLLYSVALEVVSHQEDGSPYDRTQVATLEGEAPHSTEPVPLMALDSDPGPDDESVDLDLDFSMLDTALPAAAAPAEAPPGGPAAGPPPEPAATPHDIEWEAPELPQAPGAEPEAAGPSAAEEEAAREPMLPELDLAMFQAPATIAPPPVEPLQLEQLALDDGEAEPAQDDAPVAPPPEAHGLDFSLDLDLAEPERTPTK